MKFQKANQEDFATRKDRVRQIIRKFYESGLDVCEVTDWEDTYKSFLTAYQSLRDQTLYMSRHGCPTRVTMKKGKMYLIREDCERS